MSPLKNNAINHNFILQLSYNIDMTVSINPWINKTYQQPTRPIFGQNAIKPNNETAIKITQVTDPILKDIWSSPMVKYI
jgi:hypothetical protein